MSCIEIHILKRGIMKLLNSSKLRMVSVVSGLKYSVIMEVVAI